MFTGIVEGRGTVDAVRRDASGMRLAVRHALRGPMAQLRRGDSVAVDGVCLTVVECAAAAAPPGARESRFEVDVSPQTQRRTTLGDIAERRSVNLEAALRAGAPLGGHFVSGHVDGTGAIREQTEHPDHSVLRIEADASLARFLAPRGAVCVDGVSLTIAEAAAARITVVLIPHTRARTRAGGYRIGERVNLEVDALARYLDRLLQERRAP